MVNGDTAYLSSTPGGITPNKPFAPDHLVYVGTVITASNGNSGRLYVKVQNGYELNEIHDVAISNPIDGDVLMYELSTDLWKNQFGKEIELSLISSFRFLTGN
jgi:hypothetical protein